MEATGAPAGEVNGDEKRVSGDLIKKRECPDGKRAPILPSRASSTAYAR
jgi:hypothetical protein